MKGATSLGYKILSCTSEDPGHPVQSIQASSIRSTGWQSAPSPHYPVEIVIDLTHVVELDTIQFVSHQFKIASRVDLYIASSDQTFRALGSFQFSDNTHTNFCARELKSVSLNGIRAQYIRISISGCHVNSNNLHNQVGLVSLNIVGKGGLLKSQVVPAAAVAKGGDGTDLLEDLERQKKEAVMREDFKTAQALKQQIDRLRKSYDQVMQLQRQKNEAVQHEDYATAQMLKNEIDVILGNPGRGQPLSQTLAPGREQMVPTEQSQMSMSMALPEEMMKQSRRREQEQVSASPKRVGRKRETVPADERPIHPAKGALDERPIHPAKGALDDRPIRQAKAAADERPIHLAKGAADERPIHPAKDAGDDRPIQQSRDDAKFKSPKRVQRAPPGPSELQTEADELSAANKQEAGVLVELFGEGPVAKFFSKAWNLKVEGINELAEMIKGLKGNKVDAYYRYCYIMKHRLKETHKAVFQAAIEGVKNVGDAIKLSPADLGRCINQLIGQVIPKVGCAQQPLSDIACQFLLWLAEKGQYDIVIPILTNPVKNQSQYKIALAQLKTLRKVIFAKGKLSAIPGLSLASVMGLAVPCLESPKAEVRKAATKLVITLEFICGSTIYQYLDKLPKRVKVAITDAIKASKEGGISDD